MAIVLKMIPKQFMNDIVAFVEANHSAGPIELMSETELFDAYLNWNGIIGYTHDIMGCLDSIRKADTRIRTNAPGSE